MNAVDFAEIINVARKASHEQILKLDEIVCTIEVAKTMLFGIAVDFVPGGDSRWQIDRAFEMAEYFMAKARAMAVMK